MPLLLALIYFIGYHFTFNSGISSATELADYHINSYGLFEQALTTNLNYFSFFTVGYLEDMFTNLFDILNVSYNGLLGTLFGFMLSVQLYHLLFDCLVFFIHLIHEYCDPERWCK